MEKLAKLLLEAGTLKSLPRRGWGLRGVPDPESVADHSYRVVLMSLLLGDRLELDTNKMIRMSLLHDLAEARVGDITPHDEVEDKEKKEEAAIKEMLAGLPGVYLELWHEFLAQETEEARVVKQIDKLEMGLQALEYARSHPGQDLSEFISETERFLTRKELRDIFEQAKNIL